MLTLISISDWMLQPLMTGGERKNRPLEVHLTLKQTQVRPFLFLLYSRAWMLLLPRLSDLMWLCIMVPARTKSVMIQFQIHIFRQRSPGPVSPLSAPSIHLAFLTASLFQCHQYCFMQRPNWGQRKSGHAALRLKPRVAVGHADFVAKNVMNVQMPRDAVRLAFVLNFNVLDLEENCRNGSKCVVTGLLLLIVIVSISWIGTWQCHRAAW